MKNYEESLKYIYSLIKFGVKLGLENTRAILSLIGNPQNSFRAIHIAGTNGKGSTAKMLQCILMGLGFKTGLFTSPHMVRFTERIVIDNEEISPEEVVFLTETIRESLKNVPEIKPTYFEFVTALAFKYFQERAVKWAVIETGMGGRFDATNVITPEASVITTIGLDHRQYLGTTLKEIAFQKAGIIKPGIPVIVGPVSEEPRETILEVAEKQHSPVRLYGRDFSVRKIKTTPEGTVFDFYSTLLAHPIEDLRTALLGAHQAYNAAIAIETILSLMGPGARIIDSLRTALAQTRYEGRFEVVEYSGRRLVLDGAHNPQSIRALLETLKVFGSSVKPITIFGAMADKDTEEMVLPLVKTSKKVILTRPSYERAMAPERLYTQIVELSPETKEKLLVTENVPEAMELALRETLAGEIILVTGSFYVLADAKEFMGQRGLLKELREGF